MNVYRMQAGVAPLRLHPALVAAAQNHATYSLLNHADPAACLPELPTGAGAASGQGGQVLARHGHGSGGGAFEEVDAADERGLPGAGLADHAVHLALRGEQRPSRVALADEGEEGEHIAAHRVPVVDVRAGCLEAAPHPCRADIEGTVLREAGDGALVSLTQVGMARRIGASREKVNRKLHEWGAEGWISLGRSGVRLVKRAALEGLIENLRAR